MGLMRLAWGAWLAALVPYTICFMIWRRMEHPIAGAFLSTLRVALFGLALYMGWASFRWRRRVAEMLEEPPDSNSAAASELLRGRCLAVWAMSESVAIFGLTLAFFTHDAFDFVPFASASFLLLCIHRPWTAPFNQALQNISDWSSRRNESA